VRGRAAATRLAGRVAVLGWGSLLWDLADLAPKVEGPWLRGAGPRLPLEFSRISPKRRLSLVVVIDPDEGEDCPTHAIPSRRRTVAAAACDLRRRERALRLSQIGWVCARTGRARGSDPRVVAAVRRWARDVGAAGAVWTDLDRNFAARTGAPFTVARGLAYLRGLEGESAATARRYIDGAPAETDTPLRRALAAAPWW